MSGMDEKRNRNRSLSAPRLQRGETYMLVLKNPTIRLVCIKCRSPLSYSLCGNNYRLDVLLRKVTMNVKTCRICNRALLISSIKMEVKE